MHRIVIKDITKSNRAISANDGDKVYESIIAHIEQGEKVILDFQGISLTITAFLNSAVGRLYSTYKNEKVKEMLSIENLQQQELPLLKLVVDKAKERFTKPYPTDLGEIDLLNED